MGTSPKRPKAPIDKHWLERSDLTIHEAAFWMVFDSDPVDHEKRCLQDQVYADYYQDHPSGSDAVGKSCEAILSAIRSDLIQTTKDVRSNNGDLTTRTHIRKTDWLNWCRDNGYCEFANRLGGNQKVRHAPNPDARTSTSAAQTEEKTIVHPPANDKRDIKDERGCRRLIRENWDKIKTTYGIDADGHQVRRILVDVIDKSANPPKLKTVQNCLITLRKDALIP